jgi:hypothetical protein
MNYVEMRLIPHEKWGEELIGAPRVTMNNPKNLGLRVSQKHA